MAYPTHTFTGLPGGECWMCHKPDAEHGLDAEQGEVDDGSNTDSRPRG